jgi:hypothetical protein
MPERTWLDVAHERFGRPIAEHLAPFGTREHSIRKWSWRRPDGYRAVSIEVGGDGWVRTAVRGSHRNAELGGWSDPPDADIQAACAFAWPGYREAAADA